ncbi:hypothetical protein D3C72_800340 [compost metagenome]
MLQAFDTVVRCRFQGGCTVEGRGAQREQRIVDQRRFARAGHAGHARQQTNRDVQIDIAQVVAARPFERQIELFIAWRAFGRHFNLHSAREVFTGQGIRVRHDFRRRALSHDLPTMHTSPRADIHNVIGQTNRVFVVFDHDHSVANITQVLERAEQAVVITLVQTNGRFVKDVQNTDETGADLAGQTNTLCFATGQRVGTAVQRQVVETDVDEELQTLANLLEDLVGDFAATASHLQLAEVLASFADRQVGHRWQRFLANPHMPRFATQAGTTAIRTRLGAEKLGQLFAHACRLGLAVATLQVRHDAFERVRAFDDVATVVQVFEVDVLRAAAMQDEFLLIGRQFVERYFEAETIV